MDTSFCMDALEEAIEKYGMPEIMNIDQGSQLTSVAFTQFLKDNGIRISMDGKGAWRDNVFVERLWKTVEYEHVYLHAYELTSEAKTKLAQYLDFYNRRRPHSRLDRLTPDQFYFNSLSSKEAALPVAASHLRMDIYCSDKLGHFCLNRANRIPPDQPVPDSISALNPI